MSQNDSIIKYLLEHGSISQKEAYEYCGCFRLAARIYDLRKYFVIKGNLESHGSGSHMRYYLEGRT